MGTEFFVVENLSMDVQVLEPKKRGLPLLLGGELDKRVQQYIKSL